MNIVNKLAFVVAAVGIGGLANGQVRDFKIVGDRLQYRNLANFESETEFETFVGTTTQVSGTIKFDPAKRTGSGVVVVDVASLDTGIPTRNEHMRAEGWMDAAKHPTIRFQTTKVTHLRGDDYRVTGNLTLRGITRAITTTAKVRYRAAGPAAKQAGFEGNVLQFSTKLQLKLSDYGIVIPPAVGGKVANEVTIGVSAYATAS